MIREARLEVPDADSMRTLGKRIASVLRAGDLVLLGGELGAGKTTFAQGVGAGLGVRGPVTSPTFVIARVHPSLSGGPPLVHVDAYRLGGWDELEDLDLEATLDQAVTVVEWGEGLAEGLGPDRLEVHIHRTEGADSGEIREVRITPAGNRWNGVNLQRSAGSPESRSEPDPHPLPWARAACAGHIDAGSDGSGTRRQSHRRRVDDRRRSPAHRADRARDRRGAEFRRCGSPRADGDRGRGRSGTIHQVADRAGHRAHARPRPRHSCPRRVQSRRGGARCCDPRPFVVATMPGGRRSTGRRMTRPAAVAQGRTSPLRFPSQPICRPLARVPALPGSLPQPGRTTVSERQGLGGGGRR